MSSTIMRLGLAAAGLVLLFAIGFAEDTKSPAQVKFDAIQARMEKTQSEFFAKLEAETDEAKQHEMFAKRPGAEFIADFKALAVEAKGSEVAAQSWMQVASIGGEFEKIDEVKAAAENLIADYVDSKAIRGLPGIIGYAGESLGEKACEEMLEGLLVKAKDKPLQASVIFELGQMSMRKPGKDNADKARKHFERLVKEFEGVKSDRDNDYKVVAERFLFELNNLQIGQVAPDFEVTDENGVKFKLSDYRGKVVVIDFWGFW